MQKDQYFILVVDDESDIRGIIKEELEAHHFKVITAINGKEALSKFKDHEGIDLILSDIRMPGGNGIELLNSIRSFNHKEPPLAFITGFSDVSYSKAYHLGASAILTKPFQVQDIISISETLLGIKKSTPPSQSIQIELNFWESIEEVQLNKKFAIGRNGFCLMIHNESIKKLSPVDFKIEFLKEKLEISGRGFIRWINKENSDHEKMLGVEIFELNDLAKAWHRAWVEKNNPIAFIPDLCSLEEPSKTA